MYLIRSFIFYLLLGVIQHKDFAYCKKKFIVKCGIMAKTKTITSFIVGGVEATYLQYPWMAAIMLKTDDKWEHQCGGALINANFVLTAAHCFYDEDQKLISDVKRFQIILGMNKIDKKEKYRQDQCITKIIMHEDYDYESDKNDITLMKICKPVRFRTTKIRPICVPGGNDNADLYEDDGVVAGWGLTNATDMDSNVKELLTVSLPVGSYEFCTKELKKSKKDTFLYNSTICTSSRGKGKDACGGDSGGPLMAFEKKTGKVFVRGVVSFGSSICGGYGAFTKVSYFSNWIKKNKGNTVTHSQNKKNEGNTVTNSQNKGNMVTNSQKSTIKRTRKICKTKKGTRARNSVVKKRTNKKNLKKRKRAAGKFRKARQKTNKRTKPVQSLDENPEFQKLLSDFAEKLMKFM